MNLKFEVNDEEYYTVKKSDHYGFTLTRCYPTDKRDGTKGRGEQSLFYANLEQLIGKVMYLSLDGNSLVEIKQSIDEATKRILSTLEKL